MPLGTRNVIVLKGHLDFRYEEGRAAGTIKPGMLMQRDTNNALVVHATAGAAGLTEPERIIAMEDSLQGKGVRDSYVSGDLVRYHIAMPGDELQNDLEATQNADENSPLTSNGDGALKVATGGDMVLFRAMEALDLSGGGAVDTLFCVRRV